MKKIVISFIFTVSLVQCILFSGVSVFAGEDMQQFIDDANKLKNLGILRGTGQGFELDRPLSKIEASVIMIRLLQKENTALHVNNPTPLKDVPQWADPYIGYLYKNSPVTFNTSSQFSAPGNITAEQYTSLMLGILGYDESAGDFKPGHSLDKAREIGLLSDSELKSIAENPVFNRSEAALVAYNTLKTRVKGDGAVLINKLIEQGSIGKDRVTIIGENNSVENIIVYSPTPETPAGDSAPIAFLGDSHTEGIFFVEKFSGFRTLNKGFNGYTTKRILNRINEVVDAKPRKLFMMAGTNDLWGGEEVETTVKNYALMLDIVRNHVPNCKVYIQSTLPFGEAALKRNAKASNEKVKNLNDQLVLLAKKYGATYLDIGSLYKDSSGMLDSTYSADGIHIKLEHYGRWLNVIKENMK